MTVAERWRVANEMAHAKFPFTGNPYSVREVYDEHGPLVGTERKRILADYAANGESSELSQEIARRQPTEA